MKKTKQAALLYWKKRKYLSEITIKNNFIAAFPELDFEKITVIGKMICWFLKICFKKKEVK